MAIRVWHYKYLSVLSLCILRYVVLAMSLQVLSAYLELPNRLHRGSVKTLCDQLCCHLT